MEIKYPIYIVILIGAYITIMLINSKKKNKNNKKVANTHFITNTDIYKSIIKKYKLLISILFSLLFICILASALLNSRLVTTSTHTNKIYDRDIILCLDVSGSMTNLDSEIVKSYEEIVNNMQGERFGIMLFNSSSYTLLPLTDDYEYAKDIIKETTKAFEGAKKYDFKSTKYIYEGTREGEGSSIIGDGIASCVIGFPKIDEEQRSRIIILGTDNEVAGDQIITVPEAGDLAKKYNVTIYPLSPYKYSNNTKELEDIAKKTGGKFYTVKDTDKTKEIVSEIEKKEKTVRETSPITTVNDHPQIPIIIIVMSLLGIFIMERKMIK